MKTRVESSAPLTPTRSTSRRHLKAQRHSYDDLTRDHLEIVAENSVAACTLIHLGQESGQAEQLDTMLNVFASSGTHLLHTAFHALQIEVASTPSEDLLFRCDSFCTSYLGAILRRWGHKFLRRHVAPLIKRIDALPSLEIDPLALPRWHPELDEAPPDARPALAESLLEANRGRLAFVAHEFVEAMGQAIGTLHPLLALLLVEVYHQVHALFPPAASRALGGVLFLRFIFPAFTLPDHHGLVSHCSAALRRKLVIVAKLLQCVFNEAPRRDEEYFMPLAPFIAKHLDTNKRLYECLLAAVQSRPPGPLELGADAWRGSVDGSRGSKLRPRKKRVKAPQPMNVLNLMTLFVRYAQASAQYAGREETRQQVCEVWRRQAAVVGVELAGDVEARVQEESQQFLQWLAAEIGERGPDHSRSLRSLPNLLATPGDCELDFFQSLLNTAAGQWATFQAGLRQGLPASNEPLSPGRSRPGHVHTKGPLYGAQALEAQLPNFQRHWEANPLVEEDGPLETVWRQTVEVGQSGVLLAHWKALPASVSARLYLFLCLWEALLGPEPAPVPDEARAWFGAVLGLSLEQQQACGPYLGVLLHHRTTLLDALPTPVSWTLPRSFAGLEKQAPATEAMGPWDEQFLTIISEAVAVESGQSLAWDPAREEVWRVECGSLQVMREGQVIGQLGPREYWLDLDGSWAARGVSFHAPEDTILLRLSPETCARLQWTQPAFLARLFFSLTQQLVRVCAHPQDIYLQRRMGRGGREGQGEARVPVQVSFSDHTHQWFALPLQTTAKTLCQQVAQAVARGQSCREKTFMRLYEQFVNPVSGEDQQELVSDHWTVQTIHTRAKYAQDHRLYFGRGADGPKDSVLLSTAFIVAQTACRCNKAKGTLFLLPHHVVFLKASSTCPDKEIELSSLQSAEVQGDTLTLLTHQDTSYKFTCSTEQEAQRVRLGVCALQPMSKTGFLSVTRSATVSKFAVTTQPYQPLDHTGLRVELAQTLKILHSDGDRLLAQDDQGQHGFVPARCLHLLSWDGMPPLQAQLIRDLSTSRDLPTPDAEGWRKILAVARVKSVPAGKVVLLRGMPFPHIGWVVEGQCEALGGPGQPTRVWGQGQVVGHGSLFLGFVPYDIVSLGAQILFVDISYLRALFSWDANHLLAAQFFQWAALVQCQRSLG